MKILKNKLLHIFDIGGE